MRINRIKIPSLFLSVLALILFLSLNSPATAASQPDLKPYTLSGWDYPLVPRNTDGATLTKCGVTSSLPGYSSNTYFNSVYKNIGTAAASAHWLRLYIDGVNILSFEASSLKVNTSMYALNRQSGTYITGGRHTLYVKADADGDVAESDESNNCWAKQFVWSPQELVDDTPKFFASPSYGDAWGCVTDVVHYNNDGFSFYVYHELHDKWWSAVGILPRNAAADYDLRLWDIGNYTGSEGGFGSNYIEYSSYGSGKSEFVIVNNNNAVTGTYYAGVINKNNSSGNYHIEEATSTKIYTGTNGPYNMDDKSVLDIYETNDVGSSPLPAGEYGFRLHQTSGTCNLGMSLYNYSTVHAKKNEYMTDGYANSSGNGGDEFMRLTLPDAGISGWYGLVVWKNGARDYEKSSTYKISFGKCGTPSALTGPSPANNATGVSINANLDWADSTLTEYYEVWLKRGCDSDYVKQGTTETSSWALGTLQPATEYTWYILAQNICGKYSHIYWRFKTAGLPRPADSNGDGTSDLFWHDTSGGVTAVWLMNNTGKCGATAPGTEADTNWQVFAPGDFDGDGNSDIFWTNAATNQMKIWFLDTDGDFNYEVNFSSADLAQYNLYGPADFNGDGKADILWRDKTTGQMYFWYMGAAGHVSSGYLGAVADSTYQIYGPADFDGDGIADIIWRNSVTGVMFIWYMNTTGLDHSVYAGTLADADWVFETFADFDGDGNDDIYLRNHATGQMVIWHPDAGGHITSQYIGTIPDMNWQIACSGDFNGDGYGDIIWRNVNTGVLFRWTFDVSGYTGSAYLGTVADVDWEIKNR